MTPAMRNDTIAAGPALSMTTPLPTNNPAPITPPRAMRFMCRFFRPFPRPESWDWAGGGVAVTFSSTVR